MIEITNCIGIQAEGDRLRKIMSKFFDADGMPKDSLPVKLGKAHMMIKPNFQEKPELAEKCNIYENKIVPVWRLMVCFTSYDQPLRCLARKIATYQKSQAGVVVLNYNAQNKEDFPKIGKETLSYKEGKLIRTEKFDSFDAKEPSSIIEPKPKEVKFYLEGHEGNPKFEIKYDYCDEPYFIHPDMQHISVDEYKERVRMREWVRNERLLDDYFKK